ncbi:hypothetical protein ANOBCDAF_04292 [Pleomorphomonas sp. T1.2MG-36]|uniref:GNAT family N-acetyltransferase n=1 Tax=Pleomorphomonas sp. T1.2MG-36 TaxID=3041167 RepID=UPI0024779D84|nr:GNAT family N-acetyltransferase [Pleomorphomonas sp. T1.2MG-36]CAI9418557.1 hypothetical protein ANOBCDAF_04292 [Pleomorphomonas sp. T1.2MG-36]
MDLTIVTTRDRPDLAQITGTWRWQAFFEADGVSLEDTLAFEAESARGPGLMPTVLVLLDGQQPIGMVALCLDDLEGRPELNPWLAGLYVDPAHRGQGHGLRLIAELESLAHASRIPRLSLYTAGAVGLYARAGWEAVETFDMHGEPFSIMRKHL